MMSRIIREKERFQKTGLSRVQCWRRMRNGTFPAAINIGPNSIGWLESEIDAWLASLPRANYAPVETEKAA
jgi:prophage regulatory protein